MDFPSAYCHDVTVGEGFVFFYIAWCGFLWFRVCDDDVIERVTGEWNHSDGRS